MEQIDIKNEFCKGDIVKIKETSQYYKGDEHSSNPMEVEGYVIENFVEMDYGIRVEWSNGKSNSYNTCDLILISLKDRICNNFDINKIYFKESNLTFKSISSIISHLHSGPYDSTVETYYKNETKSHIQCSKNKIRSFDDILLICQTYLPKVTVEQVFKELLLYKQNLNDVLVKRSATELSNCSTMRRVRFRLKSTWNLYDSATSYSKFNSTYSWKELFSLINIYSEEDLLNFYKQHLPS